MTAGIRAVIGAAGGSKVLDYDGSLNESIATAIAATGTPDNTWVRFGVDWHANLAAMTFYDGTNWKGMVGTFNPATDTAPSWGTPVTFSDISTASNACAEPIVLSSSLVAFAYRDNEGTPQFQIKTYSVSGNALTPDQTKNIAASSAATVYGISLARSTSSRFIAQFPNSSGYPSVIGINASAGALSNDGAATVLNSATLGDESMALRGIGSSKFMAIINWSNQMWRSVVTDTGTGTSATTITQATSTTVSVPWCIAGQYGGVAGGSGTGGVVYPFRVSGGSIAAEFLNTSTSDLLRPMGAVLSTNANGCDLKGAYLGDVDGDGTEWGVIPCCPGNAAGSIYGLFVGINGQAENPQDTIKQVIRPLTTGATNRRDRCAKTVTVDSNTFLLFYINQTDADYMNMVCRLA